MSPRRLRQAQVMVPAPTPTTQVDVVVVGGGIIGTTVAKGLQGRGVQTLLLDDGRVGAGTPPSGGHMMKGWVSALKTQEYDRALELLDGVWGVTDQVFRQYVSRSRSDSKQVLVSRVDIDAVLRHPRAARTVTAVGGLDGRPYVVSAGPEGPETVECRALVIAAGCWVPELLPELSITARRGVSFRLPGTLPEPFIKPWAPYKQVVAHQQYEGEIWIGDGTALLPANWSTNRTEICQARCQNAAEILADPLEVLIGDRPYAPPADVGKAPCLYRRLGPHAWVATGAGKLGTVAAGWVLGKLLEEL